MDTSEEFAEGAADLPDAMPERWETAIEDLAQAIALGLDRAQDLADAINDLIRTRPAVAKAVGAAAVGAVAGVMIANLTARKPKPPSAQTLRESARQASASLVDQAILIARDAAERMARRIPAKGEALGRSVSGDGAVKRKGRLVDVSRARYAAQLVPLAFALLKNPIVREYLARAAMASTRRRK